jgi:hypothetical protein
VPLDPSEQRRLTQILGMTGSAHDGEALNAVRLACRLISEAGLTWTDIVTAPPPAEIDLKRITALEESAFQRGYQKGLEEGAIQTGPRSWPALVEYCLNAHPRRLTPWETEFCTSFLSRGWLTPTARQQPILERIARKCGVPVPGSNGMFSP